MRDEEYRAEQIAAVAREVARLDLVNVVRCRDCKEFSFRDDEYATADWCDYWGAEVESLDGFCAWAERRDA